MEKYRDLYQLIEKDSAACEYVRSSMKERSDGVNSFESLRHYAENLTKGE